MSLKSKKKILDALRKNEHWGEIDYTPPVFNFLKSSEKTAIEQFKEKITDAKGEFFFCTCLNDFQRQIEHFLSTRSINNIVCIEEEILRLLPLSVCTETRITESVEASITGCEYLVAQTGSIIVSSKQTGSRQIIGYPPTHIVVGRPNQLVVELGSALNMVSEKYHDGFPSSLTVITGPSRTADIEKTLVFGAHGPKELIFFYIDQQF